jgi:hypothetical protein
MLQILAISVPIFALIAFGAVIRRTGLLTEEAHRFITRFVFLFSLPVLIFLAIAGCDFGELLDLAVVGSTLAVFVVVAAVSWVATRPLDPRLRGPVAVGPWFANLTFLGLPLAESAYGEAGIRYVGIINAFTMPVFVIVGVMMLSLGRAGGGSLLRQFRAAVFNPIVMSAVGGVVASLVISVFDLDAMLADHATLAATLDILLRTLGLIGQMGIPLALIAIGGSLQFDAVRGRLGLMTLATLGKLVVTPLLTLLACRWLFPAMPPAAVGTAVLLMASPLSVAVYVVSREMDTDSEFLAGLLVLTTAGAVISISLWLNVLL